MTDLVNFNGDTYIINISSFIWQSNIRLLNFEFLELGVVCPAFGMCKARYRK